jgi:imidazolonepropionase-like amidohydrolase
VFAEEDVVTEPVDTLIAHAHLFTMQGNGVGYVADGAVAVRGERIAAVGPTGELCARYQAADRIKPVATTVATFGTRSS